MTAKDDKRQALSEIRNGRRQAAIDKRKERKARSIREKQEEKELLAERREAKRRKEAEFKASIIDGYVTDKDGNRLRRYSAAERFLDNKFLAWGSAVGFMLLMFAALLIATNGKFLAPQ
jgi:Fe2+ transport system protein B